MQILLSLLAILMFVGLVLVHEWGHFAVARWFGIRVEEFAFGFFFRVASFVRGETRFVLNLLPIGGYVKIYGENPQEVVVGVEEKRSFVAQPRIIQGLVIVAGVVFNLLFAWLLFSAALMMRCRPNSAGNPRSL